jgi:DNA-binding MarR family transcriptional regulator
MRTDALPDLECACANVRRAARLITQLFGQEMGNNVEPSQFSLLTALSRKPGTNQALLGNILGLDKTSLSRNLRLMQKNGWIEGAVSKDRRERGYRLTAAGEKLLAETRTGWQRAQAKLRRAMTAAEWDNMQKTFGHAAAAAVRARTEETETGDSK